MGLTAIVHKAVEIAFNALGDVVKEAVYTHIYDNGFDGSTEKDYKCKLVDIKNWQPENDPHSFKELIQPEDIVVIVSGPSLSINEITINSKMAFSNKSYTIVDKKEDPTKAIFTLLLRALA